MKCGIGISSQKIYSKHTLTFAIRGKQQASGWPEDCVTNEQKTEYIRQYFDAEGILLDKAKIEKNPGLRAIMKLIANSFWGFLN
jgi:hypothetical protein